MRPNSIPNIPRKRYPQLDALLWDNALEEIPEYFAFQIYETRWRFVEREKMDAGESRLLDYLTRKYGNGLFLAG